MRTQTKNLLRFFGPIIVIAIVIFIAAIIYRQMFVLGMYAGFALFGLVVWLCSVYVRLHESKLIEKQFFELYNEVKESE